MTSFKLWWFERSLVKAVMRVFRRKDRKEDSYVIKRWWGYEYIPAKKVHRFPGVK